MSWIDKKDEQTLLREVKGTLDKKKTPNINDALVGQRLSSIYSKHPYLPTGVALSLAEANAPMDMVDQIAQKATMGKYQQLATEAEQPILPSSESKIKALITGQADEGIGSKAEKAVAGAVKFVLGNTVGRLSSVKRASQLITAAGSTVPQYWANYASRATDPNQSGSDLENSFASTSLGALLQHPNETGSGFFVGGQAEEKRVEKVRKYRWQFANGQSYTIGRGTANMFSTPGTPLFNVVSGAIDAGLAWYGDLTNKPIDEISKAVKASKVLPFIETLDEVEAARKLARGEAGLLSNAEQHAIDTSKFFNWLDNSTRGKLVVQRTAAETNELKILEAYNYRISPEQARKLALTTDPNEVRGIIAESAVRLSDETSGKIPFATTSEQLPISKLSYKALEQIPGYNVIKNNRWLAKVPQKSLLVNGTPNQKATGIQNLKNWLLEINVDPYSGEGQKLMDQAFTWAGADGTRADANTMVDLFLGNKNKKVTGVLPMALRNSGVSEANIAAIDETLRGSEQLLRKYSFGEAGVADDHGMMVHLSQHMTDDELRGMLGELFPTRVTVDMSRDQLDMFLKNLDPGELTKFGPMSLSQMLNNTVVLPDPRMIRKLMGNPFFGASAKGQQAQTARLLETIQNDVWRTWALGTLGFAMRNTFDAQTRIAMSGIARNNPWDYFLLAMNQKGTGSIMGETWKSADEVPLHVLKKVAKNTDAETITAAIDDYLGINSSIPDEVMDDLIEASNPDDVKSILNRIRPDSEQMEDYADVTKSFSRRMVEDPRNQIARLVEDNQFNVVGPDDQTFPFALIDQAGIIHADPFQRMAVQISHLPENKQIDVMTKWLDEGSKEAQKARRAIISDVSENLVGDVTNGQNKVLANIENAKNMTNRELIDAWYSTNAVGQTSIYTRNTDELRAFAGYNSVPVSQSRMIDSETASMLNNGAEPKAGDILAEPTEFMRNGEVVSGTKTHLVLEVHTQTKNNIKMKTYKIIEVVDPGSAFSRKFDETSFSKRAEQFVRKLVAQSSENRKMGLDPIVPDYALHRVRTVAKDTPDVVQTITALPRWFFRTAIDPLSRNLEKSPAWRKIYYNHVADNAHLLTSEEADKVIAIIDDAASKAFPKRYAKNPIAAMEDFVGGKPVIKALDQAANAPAARGFGTAEQLHEYASTVAKSDAEELFFNNVNRSNFTDAMRVAAPFGAAWAEIAGTYGRAVIQNPARLRKAQIVYKGLEEFDPDNDGRGFFWQDPQTQMQMFAFPLSGLAIKALTALTGKKLPETFLAAPTKQLSAGFAFIPSLGPVYQIAATQLFNAANIPDTDSIRKTVLPYGDANMSSLIPGTWKKFFEAIDADPSKLNSVFGNTYQDVFAHLSTTGEYDLTDSNDVTRMDHDAQSAGRGLTLIRALTQFIGPTSGTPQYRYKNEAGEFYYVNEMVKAFSSLQNANYDTAVEEYVKAFGMNAMIYLSGKTKVDPAYKGVEANESYGRWEKDNKDLISGFKKTAPFLAPGAFGEFSMEVYARQLAAGMRKDRDNRDRLADSQRRVGSALYKHLRNQYPEALTDSQRQTLKNYRAQIHKQHPGFPESVEFTTGEFENFISELGTLVQDPRTEGNKVADSIYEYLKFRANTKANLERDYGVSIGASKNEGARAARGKLFGKGEELATVNPDFRRIWEQELSSEIE